MKYPDHRVNDIEEKSDDLFLWRQFKFEADEEAFVRLAGKYYRKLFGYGGNFSKDNEFIRDCIQEVFVKLWERRERIAVPVSVKAYLFASLRNVILDESERLKHFVHLEQSYFLEEEGEAPLEHHLIESESQHMKIRRLNLVISKLTRRQQEIIYLRFYQGLDNDQAAEVMGLGRQSISNLLYRTLQEIRANWLTQNPGIPLVVAAVLNWLQY